MSAEALLDSIFCMVITGLHLLLYADDLVLFAEDIVPINEGLQVLHEWSERNGTNINLRNN